MPGYLCLHENSEAFSGEAIQRVLNPCGCLNTHMRGGEFFEAGLSVHEKCLLADTRIFENDRFFCLFLGTMIDYRQIPWAEICTALESGEYGFFRNFNAPYAIIGYDKQSRDAILVSDRFGQFTIYYSVQADKILLSTSIHAFRRFLNIKDIDAAWLHDFICFSYPLADATPLKNVKRALFASVIKINTGTKKTTIAQYDYPPEAKYVTTELGEAKSLACRLFSERFPLYYTNIEESGYAASITSGFDARLALAFKPDGLDEDLYTYGTVGTSDVVMGRITAKAMGLRHHAITYDEGYLERLSESAKDAVSLSGGSLNALRATLIFAYRHLAGIGKGCVISGVSGDHFFRGGISIPQILSNSTADLIKDPAGEISMMPFYEMLLPDKNMLHERMAYIRNYLNQFFNWDNITVQERHMHFVQYESAPKYFGGEAAYVDNCMEFRAPYWDAAIRKFSYSIPFSTLGFSRFQHEIPKYRYTRSIFAHMLANHPVLKNIPVSRLKPKYYATESDAVYFLGQVLTRGHIKILEKLFPKRFSSIPLEDWDRWTNQYLKRDLLKDYSRMRISAYLGKTGVDRILNSPEKISNSTFWLGRLITLELILEMLE